STPLYSTSSNEIQISLKSDIGLYKFSTINISSAIISSNMIRINNIVLSSIPKESPINWFTWDGTMITGLTDIGKQQENIVLPALTTRIDSHAFFRSNIVSIDMSLTSITQIPSPTTNNDGSTSNILEGAFTYSTKLSTIIFPKNLTFIGSQTFRGCTA
ncbi:MAG: leucine-rich repeat domain-containing protein, partial [Ureaplasma sp.]|nr:leucine-rich repeat domain-containing protein [Ureaplasma sp.]